MKDNYHCLAQFRDQEGLKAENDCKRVYPIGQDTENTADNREIRGGSLRHSKGYNVQEKAGDGGLI